MEFEIVKEKDMPLLARKRITLSAKFHGQPTPPNEEFIKGLAGKLKVNPKLIAIRHIYQRFGEGYAKVIAHVYKTEKDLKDLELTEKKKFAKRKEEAPKEEAKGEAPKEDEAKEERKEEPKEEVKGEESGKEEGKE